MMCCTAVGAVGTQPSGEGTSGNPYQIATKDNLLWFADYVNQVNLTACAILTADITVNSNVLNSDDSLNSGTFETWTPIGSWGSESNTYKGFAGEFNGGGHTISGLYFNDENRSAVGLFGMADNNGYIHDVGIKDSYFCAKSHVAGICGDLAYGRIENCWNAATVIGTMDCAGGIAGSCWTRSSMSGCYNIGKVSSANSDVCGGICGSVAKNIDESIYSISNCVSLEGKCSVAYNFYDNNNKAKINGYVSIKDATAFASGEVCWILNGGKIDNKWRQQKGTDSYPVWTGNFLIYYDDDNKKYFNETICEYAQNHLHNFELITKTQGYNTINHWHCTLCGKDYQLYNRVNELAKTECTAPLIGDGSKDNPYQIATLANLLWFVDRVNSEYEYTSACARLTADITMNASVLDSEGRLNSEDFVAWTPIGGDGVYFPGEFSEDGPEICFSGEFNGNGHTISGLYFNSNSRNNIGLFGKANNNAHIHDLGIKDSYFYGNSWVGGICGDFASGRIENCWNAATVIAYGNDAGGICGSCWQDATIANCYNIGDVSLHQEKTTDGEIKTKFGGICGTVTYNASANYSIDNCYTLMHRSKPKNDAPDPYEGLPYLNLNSDKIYGVLDGDAKVHYSYVKDAAAFTGGEVCYRLNYGVTDGSQKWYQTLGRDLLPVMDKDHKTIYYGYNNGLKYSNTPISVGAIHCRPIAATCSAGYTRDCWEDRISYNIYAEPACLNQLNAAAVVFYKPLASDPTDQINQGEVDGWTQEKNQTYGGVNFDYAAVKVFKNYDDGTKNYTADEWVSFKVTEENAYRVRLKWSCTGDKTKMNDGRYGSCTLTYRVNGGAETTLTIPSTPFEDSPEVLSHYIYNSSVTSYRLFKDDVVEFHIKNYQNACKTPCEVTWAVTLEYVQRHDIQQIEATPVTCTEKGNKENWYCSTCDTHFADYKYTIVMTDWEIPALGHSTEYHQHKDATCAEDGNIEYWHCTRCNLNYSDEAYMSRIFGSVVIPAINHAHRQFIDYTAPTAYKEGNIAYWHCPDCEKNFKDKGCVTEILGTDYILAKLLNVLHIDFAGNNAPIEKEHYVGATKIRFTEKGDAIFTVNEQEVTYPASMIKEIGFFNGIPTVEFSANEDPDNKGTFYSTFYSSLESYVVPDSFTAYRGQISDDGTKLSLTSVQDSVMSSGKGYILKGTANNGSMKVVGNTYGYADNILHGTDVPIAKLGTNDYALSLGQNGVGFYLWDGKEIGANKAYLTLTPDGEITAKAFTFEFDDGITTGITSNDNDNDNDKLYNLQGIRVNDRYKGIVIKNNKKYIVK